MLRVMWSTVDLNSRHNDYDLGELITLANTCNIAYGECSESNNDVLAVCLICSLRR